MTLTKVYENQIVVISTETYILEDLPNIMKHLKREIDADVKIIDDTVRIVCDLGLKKYEGRALRKLLIKEVKKVLKESLNITANKWFSVQPL